ncbi:MAG: hypothetical protein AAF558_05200 [Verrucomicrobiota bacterium]
MKSYCFILLSICCGLCGFFLGLQKGKRVVGPIDLSSAPLAQEILKSKPSVEISDYLRTQKTNSNKSFVSDLGREKVDPDSHNSVVFSKRYELSEIEQEALRDIEFQVLRQYLVLTGLQADQLSSWFADPLSIKEVHTQLREILSPAQVQRLEEYQQERERNALEIVANLELAKVQTILRLDDATKDYIFTAFIELQRDHNIGAVEIRDRKEAMRIRLEKLKPFLDDQQFKTYLQFVKTIASN